MTTYTYTGDDKEQWGKAQTFKQQHLISLTFTWKNET